MENNVNKIKKILSVVGEPQTIDNTKINNVILKQVIVRTESSNEFLVQIEQVVKSGDQMHTKTHSVNVMHITTKDDDKTNIKKRLTSINNREDILSWIDIDVQKVLNRIEEDLIHLDGLLVAGVEIQSLIDEN